MEEEWRIIKNCPMYEVSNLGNIRSYYNGSHGSRIIPRRIALQTDRIGYTFVHLQNNLGRKPYRVHRLVAEAFIPNPENKPQVDHINTIRTDNNVENLRWVTYKENNMNSITLEKYKNMKRWEYTEEIRHKMSESAKKRIRYPASEETKHRQSLARKKWWSIHKARKEEC